MKQFLQPEMKPRMFPMQTDSNSITKLTLVTLLSSAVFGAIVTALVTPKTGREVRSTLRTAARRLTGRTEEPDELDSGTILAAFI